MSACQGRAGEAPPTPGDAVLGTGSQGCDANFGGARTTDPDVTPEPQTVLGSIGLIELQGKVTLVPCDTDPAPDLDPNCTGAPSGETPKEAEPRVLLGRVALDRADNADAAQSGD